MGIQVLVVDDSAPVRNLLINYFTKQGMAATAIEDGRSAIQMLERSPGRFNLVITDLNMPGADGFAVLMEAKRATPDCAVVIVTGYATLDSAIQAVRVGAYDFLPKPFSLADVDRLLMRVAVSQSWRDDRSTTTEAPPREVLEERIRALEARLASLGVTETGLTADGPPTIC
jgi:DNA-binding NtrC family response regulator